MDEDEGEPLYDAVVEASLHLYEGVHELFNSEEDDDVLVIDSGFSNQPESLLLQLEENYDKLITEKSLKSSGNFETVSQDTPCSQFDVDGLRCSICLEMWTRSGEHQISCLPCGHIFGFSCIKKWTRLKRSNSKCPQCKQKCSLKEVRKLFAPAVATIDEESQKKIQFLEDKCESLERQEYEWRKLETQWKETHSKLLNQLDSSVERSRNLESILESYERRSNQICNLSELRSSSAVQYSLKAELEVENARLFDINASNHVLLARRATKNSTEHVLTKISLLSPSQREDIPLPNTMNFLKDLRLSPFDTRIVLCASLGKRLLLLNTQTKSINLSYKLPAAAWSCCWDLNDPNYIYAGLQNGVVMSFDVRQSVGEIGFTGGLSTTPIHSVHSLLGSKSVIFGSSSGFGQWSSDDVVKKVGWIEEASNEEVCISLACSTSDIVATFRPRVEFTGECSLTLPVATPSVNQGIQGCHRHFRRREGVYEKLGVGHAAVSDVRLPKTVLLDWENRLPVFAAGNEQCCALVVRNLPSFGLVQRLKPNRSYISDVKCNEGVVGCLSNEILQIYWPSFR